MAASSATIWQMFTGYSDRKISPTQTFLQGQSLCITLCTQYLNKCILTFGQGTYSAVAVERVHDVLHVVLVVLHNGQLGQAKALASTARGETVCLDQAEVVVKQHAFRHGRALAASHVHLHRQGELVRQLRQRLADAPLTHRAARDLEQRLVLQRARSEEREVVDVGKVVAAAGGLAALVHVNCAAVDDGSDGDEGLQGGGGVAGFGEVVVEDIGRLDAVVGRHGLAGLPVLDGHPPDLLLSHVHLWEVVGPPEDVGRRQEGGAARLLQGCEAKHVEGGLGEVDRLTCAVGQNVKTLVGGVAEQGGDCNTWCSVIL